MLDGDEPLSEREIERLYQLMGERGEYERLDVAAMSDAVHDGESPGPDYPKVWVPVYDKLIPHTIDAQRDEPKIAERFLRLWAADPVRTDVLSFLSVQRTVEWLRQHFPAARVAAILAGSLRQLAAQRGAAALAGRRHAPCWR